MNDKELDGDEGLPPLDDEALGHVIDNAVVKEEVQPPAEEVPLPDEPEGHVFEGGEELVELPAEEPEPVQIEHTHAAPAEPAPAEEPEPAEPVHVEEEPVREPFVGVVRPNPQVEEALPVMSELTEEDFAMFKDQAPLLLSNMDQDELNKISASIDNQIIGHQPERRELAKRGKAQNYYEIDVGKGIMYVTEAERQTLSIIAEYAASLRTSARTDIFEQEGDAWTNLPALGDAKIAMGAVDYTKSKDPLVRIRGKLGLATQYSNPMWGSGMHLVIEGAGALEQLALDQRVLAEKAEGGRETSGYIYGASALYLNRLVVDFALSNVKESTAGTTNPDELKNILSITDIEPLALAMASANHPDGYLLERPCLSDFGGCGEVVSRKVNLRRMLFVRRSRIGDNQFNLMTKKSGVVDVSRIRTYQEQMRPEITRLVELIPGLWLRFKVPTIAEYERVASAWLDKMDRKARIISASNANQQEREDFMTKASRIAVVMAYGHWINAVLEAPNGDAAAEPVMLYQRLDSTDPEAQFKADMEMDAFLESLAANPEYTDKITSAMETFISNMTIATPAIPKVRCPKCHEPLPGEENSKHPHLVNINAVELFFTLLHLRMLRLGA